jgi:hypothetical protein
VRYISSVIRVLVAAVLIWIAVPFAGVFEGVEVTAPGLVKTSLLLLALWLLVTGFSKVFAPARHIAVEAPGYGLEPARLVGSTWLTIRRSRELRARHEAAHAVAAFALGHQVLSASVAPDRGSGGRVMWRHRNPALALASVDHVAIAYAGPLAERTGDVYETAQEGSDDYSTLMRTAIAASITDPEARTPSEILDEGTRCARRLIEAHAQAVDALTRLLIATDEERDVLEEEIAALMRLHGVGSRSRPQQ